jgi:hypothetical protein
MNTFLGDCVKLLKALKSKTNDDTLQLHVVNNDWMIKKRQQALVELATIEELARFIDELLEMNVQEPFPSRIYTKVMSEEAKISNSMKLLQESIDRFDKAQENMAEDAKKLAIGTGSGGGVFNSDIISKLLGEEGVTTIENDTLLTVRISGGMSIKNKIDLIKTDPQYAYLFDDAVASASNEA